MFKEIPATIFYKFTDPGTDGAVLEGKYLGNRQMRGNKGMQTVYDVEVKAPEGIKYVMVSGYAFLERQMARIEVGETIRISYLGEQKPQKGGNPYKAFKVEVDR